MDLGWFIQLMITFLNAAIPLIFWMPEELSRLLSGPDTLSRIRKMVAKVALGHLWLNAEAWLPITQTSKRRWNMTHHQYLIEIGLGGHASACSDV